jgi:site-specific recombinase XerD
MSTTTARSRTLAVATALTPDDLLGLVDSWVLMLQAERRTQGTIKTYLDGVRPFLAWCDEQDRDPLASSSLQEWTVGFLTAGRSASTAKTRMMAVRHFSRWLAAEGEIPADPFKDLRPPKVDQAVIPVLSDDELVALFKACQPPAQERTGLQSLRHRRDEAILRLMAETGMRASECLNLDVADVDLADRAVVIRRGKGGKGRTVRMGTRTASAIDKYLRVRRLHRLADTSPRLWLGDRGRELAYGGLYFALTERAKVAGIEHFHPHMLRHTATDRWLAAGGTETGAMANMGWSSLEMVSQRYGKANRERRAMEEADRLNLGDL